MSDLDDLIIQYKESRKRLRKLKNSKDLNFADLSQINSMISTLSWTIFYMKNGYPPEESPAYQTDYEVSPIDPHLLDSIDPECAQYMLETQRMFDHRGIEERTAVSMSLASMFNVLSDRQYEAVLLRSEGYSERDSAEVMGISRRSVRRHLSRAREKLNNLLENR